MRRRNIIVQEGYEPYEEGKLRNVKTGEIIDSVIQEVAVGTVSYSPERQEEFKKRREREKKNAVLRGANKELGKFFFVDDQKELLEIKEASLTRVFFLYSQIGRDNEIRVSPRGRIAQPSDLPKLLMVSRNSAKSFWQEVEGTCFEMKEDGIYGAKDESFHIGNINWKKHKGKFFQRVYKDGIRSLYQAATNGQKKLIGYFFKMRAYINCEYNVLCWNPDEEDKNSIDAMTLSEFCKGVGFNVDNLRRLRKELSAIEFIPKGKEKPEPFLIFKDTGVKGKQESIIVNPRIIYSGEDFRKVETFEIDRG